MKNNTTFRYCGRLFTEQEMDWIRDLISENPQHNRLWLSRSVCEKLNWVRPNGRSKEMSCRVAMLRMEKDGLITLPAPQKKNNNGKKHIRLTPACEPQAPLSCSLSALQEIIFKPVDN